MTLKYTGGGYGGSLPGIPARDLSEEEAILHGGVGALLRTGLYEKEKESPPLKSEKSVRPNKQETGPREDKSL